MSPPEMTFLDGVPPTDCGGPDGHHPCGRDTQVICTRCGCQRCFDCCIDVRTPELGTMAFTMHCPMCPRTDPELFPPPEVH
jgi:hypothetical protein